MTPNKFAPNRWPTRLVIEYAAVEAAKLGHFVPIRISAIEDGERWACRCGRFATAIQVWPSGAHEGVCDEHLGEEPQ